MAQKASMKKERGRRGGLLVVEQAVSVTVLMALLASLDVLLVRAALLARGGAFGRRRSLGSLARRSLLRARILVALLACLYVLLVRAALICHDIVSIV